MIISDIADGVVRGVETTLANVNQAFFEPSLRIGVTGLSRSGKTVFITALVANLLARGRMVQFQPQAQGRILTAYLQPQPDDTLPRFDYERHLQKMTGAEAAWPEGTRSISELRISLKVRPKGLLAGLSGPRVVHLDIVDYPGEWLLDLSLLELDHARWSAHALGLARNRPQAEAFLAALAQARPDAPLDEPAAQDLARHFTDYLRAARTAGYSDCSPGRFLLPGDLAGSPVLTFTPLPEGASPRGSLAREFARRFEAYKREVVKPFFRDHFARIDRQIVLVDVLGAIHAGPPALEDLRGAMADILRAFRPGTNSLLGTILRGRRVERILFAATKADHLHQSQHAQLTAITEALLAEARGRADFAGAETAALSIASLRATTEDRIEHQGRTLDVVRGVLSDTGKSAAFYPGALPTDPAHLLGPAQSGAARWLDADYGIMSFAPQRLTLAPGEGPPHIRLDRAAQFLIGDRL